MNITNNNGLLTNGTTNVCLGYLMVFEGHGTFEPSHGKVDVTKEVADKHNQILSEAELKGLDENCQVGQQGTFYYSPLSGVRTWVGTVVAPPSLVTIKGKTITFQRGTKVYRGRLKTDDFFTFERVS